MAYTKNKDNSSFSMIKHNIKAVHKSDLQQLMDSLCLSELMARGELRCGICGALINLDNLLCIYPSRDEVMICCKNQQCYEKVLKQSGQ